MKADLFNNNPRKLMYLNEWYNVMNNKYQLDLSNHKKGIYFLRIMSDKFVFFEKLMLN